MCYETLNSCSCSPNALSQCTIPTDSRSKALALSMSIPHAWGWLNVVPSKSLGLHFHDWKYMYKLSLQYWQGVGMIEEDSPCSVCQAMTDPYGDHQVGCGGNGDKIHRHNSLKNVLFFGCMVCSSRSQERNAVTDPWIQQLTSTCTSQPGKGANWQLLMSHSFLRCSSVLSRVLL